MARSSMSTRVAAGLILAGVVAAGGESGVAAAGESTSKRSQDLLNAVNHGQCDKAVKLANQDAQSDDARAIFLIGRMADEGVCVAADEASATPYFERAAALGSQDAELEYAVQVGLGEGVGQSYEHAGELCQKAGLKSPGSPSSGYALGYVCTVSGVASRLLRESLPPHPFVKNSGVTQVSFNPATGAMRIRSTPKVTRLDDSTTGTYLSRPAFDANYAIDNAFKRALGTVPKPDTTRLTNQDVELTLDLEMPIEGQLARQRSGEGKAAGVPQGVLMPGDIHATTTTMSGH